MVSIARLANRYRVEKRFKNAGKLPMGKTFQNEIVRIHRYSDFIRVTDITFAGKRGKKCEEFTVQLTYSYKGDRDAWIERISGEFVDLARRGLPAMKAFIKDLLHDFPGEITLEERALKAIAVEPYGEVFEFKIPGEGRAYIEVQSSPIDFRVINHAAIRRRSPGREDPAIGEDDSFFFQDTSYYPRKREDAAVFYAWMKDNHAKAERNMTMDMFRELWRHMGIGYDYH